MEHSSPPTAADRLSPQDLSDLHEFLSIESVSADAERSDAIRDAASWLVRRVITAGGHAHLHRGTSPPLVVGRFESTAGRSHALRVLLYGHYDVQPAGDEAAWETPPFRPTQVGPWLHARGVADDKGQMFALLRAAERLVELGELAVDVDLLFEGEEETGGDSGPRFVRESAARPDVCVIFDTGPPSAGIPVACKGVRGCVFFAVHVRTGDIDLHSGSWGGAAPNALHVLLETLRAVAHPDGSVPPELMEGAMEPTPAELSSWTALGNPAVMRRVWTEPSIDIHGVAGGEAHEFKTIIPAEARAMVSMRLAPGQDDVLMAERFEVLLRDACPSDAKLQITRIAQAPGGITEWPPWVADATQRAFEDVYGQPPVSVRMGGSLPIFVALSELGVPTVLSGIALPESNVHGPDERVRVEDLHQAYALALALLRQLGSGRSP